AGNIAGAREGGRRLDGQVERFRGLREVFTALHELREVVDLAFREFGGFLLLEVGQDSVVSFGQRALMRGLNVVRRDDGEAVFGLDGLAELAFVENEQGRTELRRISKGAEGFI